MNVDEFRIKIKPDINLIVENKRFLVKEVVKFRLNDGTFYTKCWLSDNYVFADDLDENEFILVKKIKTSFKQPFPEKLEFDNMKFEFLYTAHAIAEEIQGEEIFKKGEKERFWDYKSDDNHYLSLGINDETKERLDFYGKIISPDQVKM